MKFSVEFDTLTCDIDLLGEILRDRFFDQNDHELGCHGTFTLRPEVKKMPSEVDEEDGIIWTCATAEFNGMVVEMRYFWDGDGTLEFSLPDCLLSNDDCKKTHGWTRLV